MTEVYFKFNTLDELHNHFNNILNTFKFTVEHEDTKERYSFRTMEETTEFLSSHDNYKLIKESEEE